MINKTHVENVLRGTGAGKITRRDGKQYFVCPSPAETRIATSRLQSNGIPHTCAYDDEIGGEVIVIHR